MEREGVGRKSLIVRTGISRTKSFLLFPFFSEISEKAFWVGIKFGKREKRKLNMCPPGIHWFWAGGRAWNKRRVSLWAHGRQSRSTKDFFPFPLSIGHVWGKKWASHHLATFFGRERWMNPSSWSHSFFYGSSRVWQSREKVTSGTLFSYGGAPVWAVQVFCLQASLSREVFPFGGPVMLRLAKSVEIKQKNTQKISRIRNPGFYLSFVIRY